MNNIISPLVIKKLNVNGCLQNPYVIVKLNKLKEENIVIKQIFKNHEITVDLKIEKTVHKNPI